jgi:hypothetical protein
MRRSSTNPNSSSSPFLRADPFRQNDYTTQNLRSPSPAQSFNTTAVENLIHKNGINNYSGQLEKDNRNRLKNDFVYLQNRLSDLKKALQSVDRESRSCNEQKDTNVKQIMEISNRTRDRQQLERITNNFSRQNEKIDARLKKLASMKREIQKQLDEANREFRALEEEFKKLGLDPNFENRIVETDSDRNSVNNKNSHRNTPVSHGDGGIHSPQNSAQNLQNNETGSIQEPDRSSNLMQDNVSSIDGTFPMNGMNVSVRPEYLSETTNIDTFGSINAEIGAIKTTFSSVYNQIDNANLTIDKVVADITNNQRKKDLQESTSLQRLSTVELGQNELRLELSRISSQINWVLEGQNEVIQRLERRLNSCEERLSQYSNMQNLKNLSEFLSKSGVDLDKMNDAELFQLFTKMNNGSIGGNIGFQGNHIQGSVPQFMGAPQDFFSMIKGRNIGEDVWKYNNKRSILYTLLSWVVIPILACLFMLLYPLKAFINFIIKLFFMQNTHNMKGRIDGENLGPDRKGSKTKNDKNGKLNRSSSLENKNGKSGKTSGNSSMPSHSLRLQLLFIISLVVIIIIAWAVYLYGFEKEEMPQNSVLDYLLRKFVSSQRSVLEFLEARINVDIDKDGMVGESVKVMEISDAEVSGNENQLVFEPEIQHGLESGVKIEPVTDEL